MIKQARRWGIVTSIAVAWAVGVARLAPAQNPAPAAPSPLARKTAVEPAIATVGGVRIPRSEFEQRMKQAEESYRTRSSMALPAEIRPVFRRQILEILIRERLIQLEARRRGLSLTADQAEEELKKDPFFTRNGMFDEARFVAIKSTQPEQFRQAVSRLQNSFGALKVKDELDRQCAPDPAQLSAKTERELSRAAVEYLPLARAAYDQPGPEPSEAEVLAHYRAHGDELRHPGESQLVVLLVNKPPLASGADQNAVQAWESRMRQRADSLLGVARRGTPLEDLAAFGELRDATVSPGHFPAYWIGGARTRDAALAAAPGTLLPEAVRAEHGWLLARIDQRTPARPARIEEVSAQIRAQIRDQRVAERDANELQTLYAGLRDSLRGPAYRLRYALADTARFAIAEPSAADLDRYYRGHQADYTHFDRSTSTVQSRPFAQVRDDVRLRLVTERRRSGARAAAEQLLATWRQGRRDPKLERAMSGLREVGPWVAGAVVDTGAAGKALTDSLSEGIVMGAGMLGYPGGWVVVHAFAEIKDYVPTLQQSMPLLRERQAARQATADERAARALYEQDPGRFRTGDVVRFSRLMVEPPDPGQIQLSRAEVENWYSSHIEDYGAPELVRARHILVKPRDGSPEADREARDKAEAIYKRIRGGESFMALAQQLSDDVSTREAGGDLGVFRRGMMLEDFERAAFTMSAGDLRGPVKTEVGYHVVECLEHVPSEVVPLKYGYANVAADAAREKARRVARFRADSLSRVLKSGAAARAVGRRMGYQVYDNDHVVGDDMTVPGLKDYFEAIEKLRPRQFYSGIQEYRGMGFAVTWCDTVLPPRPATWEEARTRAIDFYRQETARHKMLGKRAELDSMMKAGWSLDSLARLMGGFRRQPLDGAGIGLTGLGGAAIVDSLIGGTATRGPVLSPGQVTGWVEFPGGVARIRLVDRTPPDQTTLASRVESRRRIALEQNLRNAFDKLKQRFPVKILDHDLEITELPALTEMPS